MVRLHVVDHKVVNLPVPYLTAYVPYVFFLETCLHSVYQSDFLVHDKIGIVADPERERPHAFKDYLGVVIYSDITDLS